MCGRTTDFDNDIISSNGAFIPGWRGWRTAVMTEKSASDSRTRAASLARNTPEWVIRLSAFVTDHRGRAQPLTPAGWRSAGIVTSRIRMRPRTSAGFPPG